MKIIDAHGHIDYITCDIQRDVVGMICCATNESDWDKIVNLMMQNNCVYGAFGIHPWFVDTVNDNFIKSLRVLLESNPCYMIGEIGLDKYKPNMEKQMDIFIQQFDLATELHRTMFLHCVGAWDKILHVLKQYKKSELPIIVVHDFNENQDITNKLLQYENVVFSFGKNALYGKNCRIAQIPSNRILVESDGKIDIVLTDVIEKIANIKDDANIPDIIYNNTKRIMNNGQIK